MNQDPGPDQEGLEGVYTDDTGKKNKPNVQLAQQSLQQIITFGIEVGDTNVIDPKELADGYKTVLNKVNQAMGIYSDSTEEDLSPESPRVDNWKIETWYNPNHANPNIQYTCDEAPRGVWELGVPLGCQDFTRAPHGLGLPISVANHGRWTGDGVHKICMFTGFGCQAASYVNEFIDSTGDMCINLDNINLFTLPNGVQGQTASFAVIPEVVPCQWFNGNIPHMLVVPQLLDLRGHM